MSVTTAAPAVAVRHERHTPDRTNLTRTQADVLARLDAGTHLWPHGRGRGAIEPGPSTAGPRTLRALADAGHAHLVVSRPGSGVLPYYAAGTGRVHLFVVRDRDGARFDELDVPMTYWSKGPERQARYVAEAQEDAQARTDRTGEPHSVLVVQ